MQPLQTVNTNGATVWGHMPPPFSFPHTPGAPHSPPPASLHCSDPRHTSTFFSSVFLSLSFIPLGSLQATTVRRKSDTAVYFQLDLQDSCKIKGQIAFVKSSHPEQTNIGPLPGVLHPHTPPGPWLSIHSPFQAFFSCGSKVKLANEKRKRHVLYFISLRDDVANWSLLQK